MKDALRGAYGHWGDHPNYPLKEWKLEVSEGDTRLGYWEWVEGMLTDEEITQLNKRGICQNTPLWSGTTQTAPEQPGVAQ